MKTVLALLIPLLLLCAGQARAQSCSPCRSKPRISHFDLDVKVPKPNDSGEAFLKWRQLFWFSRFAQSKVFELNKNCVYFIQPLHMTSEGNASLVVGETTTVLPTDKNVSKYIDYLITGTITGSGDDYVMHLELQSACGRKKVASASIPFRGTLDPAYTMQIADQTALAISPLADKINGFENQQREANKDVALGNREAATITVKPKKNKLAVGEETEVEITIRDCDGKTLPGREIVFTKGELNGLPVNGTTGGTMTPARVTTDNNGKAKAKFKMGNGKTAMIYAHHLFKKPSGCASAMLGSAPMGAVPVKVEIVFNMERSDDFRPEIQLGAVKVGGGEAKSSFSRFYRAVFYHYPTAPKEYLVLIDPETGQGGTTIYETAEGYFVYMKQETEAVAKLDFAGMKYNEVLTEAAYELNSGTVRPRPGEQIAFMMGNQLDPMSFFINFNFQNEEEDHEIGSGGIGGSVSVSNNDPGGKITINRITDPQSPYKKEYIIEFNRDPNEDFADVDKMLGTNFSNMKGYKVHGFESLWVRILSPYE